MHLKKLIKRFLKIQLIIKHVLRTFFTNQILAKIKYYLYYSIDLLMGRLCILFNSLDSLYSERLQLEWMGRRECAATAHQRQYYLRVHMCACVYACVYEFISILDCAKIFRSTVFLFTYVHLIYRWLVVVCVRICFTFHLLVLPFYINIKYKFRTFF